MINPNIIQISLPYSAQYIQLPSISSISSKPPPCEALGGLPARYHKQKLRHSVLPASWKLSTQNHHKQRREKGGKFKKILHGETLVIYTLAPYQMYIFFTLFTEFLRATYAVKKKTICNFQ